MTTSQSSVLRLYLSVIEDVISGVRECFLDEGVDEQVLQELKQSWESKLQSSKALEQNHDPGEGYSNARGGVKLPKKNVNDAADAGVNAGVVYTDDVRTEKMYPVQITLPAQQNTGETAPRVLTIQVPESAIAGNQLQQVLTGPLIGATLALPTTLATTLLQQHVTAALRGQQTGSLIASRSFAQNNPAQLDGAGDECPDVKRNVLPSSSSQASGSCPKATTAFKQLDGGMDSSDDDDEDDDDEDDDIDGDDADGDGDENEGDEGAEEEPLNSGDDVSEEDVTDLFDTENVVVCQYDKITRSRNKWKFYLKDGVMNLQGKDYVFQKSNGDAEW